MLHHFLGQRFDPGEPLVRLPFGKLQDEVLVLGDAALEALAVETPDVVGRNDKELAGTARDEAPNLLKNAPFDDARIGTLRRFDIESRHEVPLYHAGGRRRITAYHIIWAILLLFSV